MPVTLTGGGFKKEKVFVEFLSLASLMVKDIEILRQAKESGEHEFRGRNETYTRAIMKFLSNWGLMKAYRREDLGSV